MDTIQMDQNQLNDALYDKMDKEQQEYRAWLTAQPPDEILNHAVEFTVREDILIELEMLDLSAQQAAVLLSSPAPLADLYREWGKVETHHMEDIRDVIENYVEDRAKDADRPSVLEGLKRPAQPGPDKGASPKHSGPEL